MTSILTSRTSTLPRIVPPRFAVLAILFWAVIAPSGVSPVFAQDEIRIESGKVTRLDAQPFELPIRIRHTFDLAGFALCISYDTTLFDLVQAMPSHASRLSGFDAEPETFETTSQGNRITVLVEFQQGDHDPPNQLGILWLPFLIKADAPHGAVGSFGFLSEPDPNKVADFDCNVYFGTTDSDTTEPGLIAGAIEVCNDPSCILPVNATDTLEIVSTATPSGVSVPVDIDLRNAAPLDGLAIRLRYDPTLVTPVLDAPSSKDASQELHPRIEQLRGEAFDILNSAVPAPGVVTAVGLYMFGNAPPGDGPILRFWFDVPYHIPPGWVVPIEFEQDPWAPAGHNNYSTNLGLDLRFPVLIDGAIEVDSNSCLCLGQGDVNGNGIASEVGDVVYLINYLFRASGAPLYSTPNCPAPNNADVNCDGRINLVDVVVLIQYIVGNISQLCDPCTGYPVPEVAISDDDPVSLLGDPYEFIDAAIVGDLLKLTMSYSGGCSEHEFDVFMSPASFMESNPVQANIYPMHSDPGDPCDAVITESYWYDLTPVMELYRSTYSPPGSVLLNIYNADHTAYEQVLLEFDMLR